MCSIIEKIVHVQKDLKPKVGFATVYHLYLSHLKDGIKEPGAFCCQNWFIDFRCNASLIRWTLTTVRSFFELAANRRPIIEFLQNFNQEWVLKVRQGIILFYSLFIRGFRGIFLLTVLEVKFELDDHTNADFVSEGVRQSC